jgi:hypothetical protein
MDRAGALRRAALLAARHAAVGAGLLRRGAARARDLLPYGAVCIAAGAALGADLACRRCCWPPLGERLGAGTGFGLFTLLGKLALALAGLACRCWRGSATSPARAVAPAWCWPTPSCLACSNCWLSRPEEST